MTSKKIGPIKRAESSQSVHMIPGQIENDYFNIMKTKFKDELSHLGFNDIEVLLLLSKYY